MEVHPAYAPSPAPAPDLAARAEQEVDRIQKSAEKQLAALHGLNVSLIKKIRKSDAQSETLLRENKALEDKNQTLCTQLERANDDVRVLTVKEQKLKDTEHQLAETTSLLVASEHLVKKKEAEYDSVVQERDSLQIDLADTNRKLTDTTVEYADYKDVSTRERDELHTTVSERVADIQTLTKERDDTIQQREFVAANLKAKEAEYDHTADQLQTVTEEKDILMRQSEARIADLDGKITVLIADLENEKSEHNDLKKDHQELTEDKQDVDDQLKATTYKLEETTANLEKKTDDFNQMEHAYNEATVKIASLEEELDTMREKEKQLDATIVVLTGERDQLTDTKEKLTTELEETHNVVTERTTQLEDRNLAYTSLESERNLLQSEKTSLESDYAEARDRGTTLEREKTTLEMRVLHLEEEQKRLTAAIAALETDKVQLGLDHQRDLREALLKTHLMYAASHDKLRKELDGTMGTYTQHNSEEYEKCDRDFPAPVVVEEKKKEEEEEYVEAVVETQVVEESVQTEVKDTYDEVEVQEEKEDRKTEAIAVGVGAVAAAGVAVATAESITASDATPEVEVSTDTAAAYDIDSTPGEGATTDDVIEPAVEPSYPSFEDAGDGTAVMVRTSVVGEDEEDEEDEDEGDALEDDGVPEAPEPPAENLGERVISGGDIAVDVDENAVLEEVEEEVPVDEAEAKDALELAMGVKQGVEEIAGVVRNDVTEGATESYQEAETAAAEKTTEAVATTRGAVTFAEQTVTEMKGGVNVAANNVRSAPGEASNTGRRFWGKWCCMAEQGQGS